MLTRGNTQEKIGPLMQWKEGQKRKETDKEKVGKKVTHAYGLVQKFLLATVSTKNPIRNLVQKTAAN